MSDVKKFLYCDTKVRDENKEELAEKQQQQRQQLQATGLEADLSSIWSIMKNVNVKGSDSTSSTPALAGTLPSLNANTHTNYYSRYGNIKDKLGKAPGPQDTLKTSTDVFSSKRLQSQSDYGGRFGGVQSPNQRGGASGDLKQGDAPVDPRQSFRSK